MGKILDDLTKSLLFGGTDEWMDGTDGIMTATAVFWSTTVFTPK